MSIGTHLKNPTSRDMIEYFATRFMTPISHKPDNILAATARGSKHNQGSTVDSSEGSPNIRNRSKRIFPVDIGV